MEEIEKEAIKPQPIPPAGAPAKPPAESRLNRFLVRSLRRLLGFLVIAGLGALLVIFTLYLPLRREVEERQAQVEQAQQQVSELEGEIERFSPLEAENQALQAELDQAKLHVAILSARADIATAQFALKQNDAARARLALSKTGETLKQVESMLKPGEKKLATDLRSRLDLAFKGIGENAYAAASDLDVLATGLIELENAYFAKP